MPPDQPRSDDPAQTVADTVSAEQFRQTMALLPAAVNIVTSDGPGGRAGLTASAVCSVTDAPPTLLVCVNALRSTGDAFLANKALCVNTIGPEHEDLARLFGGRTPPEERFAAGDWRTGRSGAPVLTGALASFDCQVDEVKTVGTHHVLFCRVLEVAALPGGQASVYFARRFHALAP